MPKFVGITGACGFIGGALSIALKKKGFKVVGVDLVNRPHLLPYFDTFYNTDFESIIKINSKLNQCGVIIHCAGTSLVSPSLKDPSSYYYNNVGKTIKLLDWVKGRDVHFIFSSSASVYKAQQGLLTEISKLEPLSPYAKSKLMVEELIEDYSNAYDLKSTIFRYFNACGAMNEDHGQPPNSEHIFPKLFESKDDFLLNGINYKTKDGTCIRDYVHIEDIARAHILAIDKKCNGVYNLGSSIGYSNLDIINAVGKKYKDVGKREGDADCLIADISLARKVLGWAPTTTLPNIVKSLKRWYNSKNYMRQSNAAGSL